MLIQCDDLAINDRIVRKASQGGYDCGNRRLKVFPFRENK